LSSLNKDNCLKDKSIIHPQSIINLLPLTMARLSLLLVCASALLSTSNAFQGTFNSFVSGSRMAPMRSTKNTRSTLSMRVVDVDSERSFDQTIEAAGKSLVVVDYSTTWCGPCKAIAPKFNELSDKYPDAVFLQVIGDASQDTSKLMKREGVRSVPSFHFWVDGKKIDVVNGANADAIEAAITKNIS